MAFSKFILLIFTLFCSTAIAQLSHSFYDDACPDVQSIVRSVMTQVITAEPRMGASLIRLFFHDCFVQGCDASILLDDAGKVTGEKTAPPNLNSARGFDVIDKIKARLEASCKGVVSCADILALAARDGIVLLQGPTWDVPLGRRDAKTASLAAVKGIPGPSSSLSNLISTFEAKGLSARDMTALSGAHSIGQARCNLFRDRIYSDANIDAGFATSLKQNCPVLGGGDNLAPLDNQTINQFDNSYYKNLVAQRGLLHSDQELFNHGSQDALVQTYANNADIFTKDFVAAMIKMSMITPLTGTNGMIRKNCRTID